jgi:hypothetical protein
MGGDPLDSREDRLLNLIRSRKAAPGPRGRWVQIGARHAIFQGMDETKLEKLARLSERGTSKVVGAHDLGAKMRPLRPA